MNWRRPYIASLILCLAIIFQGLLGNAAELVSETAGSAREPAPPPLPESPVALFRSWLALSQPDRILALAYKTESTRRVLLTKLSEYDAMDPEQRELRLRATELQYYLRPLLQTPPADRAAALSKVPDEFRSLAIERLAQWDAIDANTRATLIDKAWAIRYFVRLETGANLDDKPLPGGLPPQRRAQFEAELSRWEALTSRQRNEITRAFHEFFELPAAQQLRALDTLPDSERQQIDATLRAFARLAPAQRQACLESFGKFTMLTQGQRGEFLRNANRWNEMSPGDRAAWRRLVHQLPPLPPGSISRQSPPIPPGSPPVSR